MKLSNKKNASHRTGNDRGSVLIFVVGILVLLALSATAFLATSRTDRQATATYESNIQVDMLINSCIETVKAALLSTPDISDEIAKYQNYTNAGSNPYLATRIPVKYNMDPSVPFTPTAKAPASGPLPAFGVNPGVWTRVTAPMWGTNFQSPTGQIIPDTFNGKYPLAPYAVNYKGAAIPTPVFTYDFNPGVAGFQSAGAVSNPSQDLTTFNYVQDPATGGTLAITNNMLFAGDADGDGVADSLPVKLPIGPINGVTYYAYFRVIDNNSAINVNTAMSRDTDFSGDKGNKQTLPDTTPLVNLGYFTSNIGLAEMTSYYPFPGMAPLPPNRDITDLGIDFVRYMDFHFTLDNLVNYTIQNSKLGVWSSSQSDRPYNDDGAQRFDFAYYSHAEAFERIIGSRPENPGRTFVDPTTPTNTHGHAFSVTDATVLASRFILRFDDVSTKTNLEKVLDASIYSNALVKTTDYDPRDSQLTWFTDNFNFDAAATPHIRSLITGAGDTRNMVPTVFDNKTFISSYVDLTTPGTISFKVTPAPGKNVPAFYQSVSTAYPTQNGTAYNDSRELEGNPNPAGMSAFPIGGATAKTSIQTAPFSELYRAFWQVFSSSTFTGLGDDKGSPFGDALINHFTNFGPYEDTQYNTANHAPVTPAAQPGNWPRMFRSPIRSVADTRVAVPPSEGPLEYRSATTGYSAVRMPVDQVILLRSAIAAQNLDTMRHINRPVADAEETPDIARYRDITLKVETAVGPGPQFIPTLQNVMVRVFGVTRQPYITEVFVHTDTTATFTPANAQGYIAIELYNPYDVAINITNCRFATINRLKLNEQDLLPTEVSLPQLVLKDTSRDGAEPINLSTVPGLTIPPKGYLVLHNLGTLTPAALRIPASAGVVSNAVFVPNLHMLWNREFVLMRPLGATITPGTSPGSPYVLNYVNLSTTVADPALEISKNFMPLDSFDLTGCALMNTPANARYHGSIITASSWHYQRETLHSNGTDWWRFVYPGRYDGTQAEHANNGAFPFYPRQMGTAYARSAQDNDTAGWQPAPAGTLGGYETEYWKGGTTTPSPAPTLGRANTNVRQASRFSIQLVNRDWPGVRAKHAASDPNMNAYPFGQFARLGDVMQVPYIGAYMIYSVYDETASYANMRFYEVNSITMDAAMAEDGDVNDDPLDSDQGFESREQIGRFAPLRASLTDGTTGMPAVPISPDKFNATGDTFIYGDGTTQPKSLDYSDDSTNLAITRYAFGKRIFDFFCLNSPADDYMPNVKVSKVFGSENTYGYYDGAEFQSLMPPASGSVTDTRVDRTFPAVQNSRVPFSDHTNNEPADDLDEQSQPVRGMININTAPWEVLAMIPWLPNSDFLEFDKTATAYLTYDPSGNANNVNDNVDLAKAIVYWRDGDLSPSTAAVAPDRPPVQPQVSPFKSIVDIYKCPPVLWLQDELLARGEPGDPANPGGYPFSQLDQSGRITGGAPYADGVRFDFEEQFMLLNRVSNLITTRSDTFTVYILLQGWRNAGTAEPQLVTQRRASFIFDRSMYNKTGSDPKVHMIPNN